MTFVEGRRFVRTVHGFVRPPMLANDQRRWHWSRVSRAKTAAQFAVWAAVRARPRVPPLDRVRLHVTWYVPDRRRRDPDGLGPFLKSAADALVEAGVIVDDDSTHVVRTSSSILLDRERPRIEMEVVEIIGEVV